MANERVAHPEVTQLTYLEPDPEPPEDLAPPRRIPPPLPPRKPTQDSVTSSFSFSASTPTKTDFMPQEWHGNDPAWSSMQSLVPTESAANGRRTLLLIYIHGFMGNEASFQEFPWHAHQVLSTTMQESHVVHTKLYPRYKSRKSIEFARDEFSEWLEPHENPMTDVVLLGHSMGGILAAEVALLPSSLPGAERELRHSILGTISFDTPFLGMHPGLVVSGISSLFRTAPVQAASPQPSQAETLASTTASSQASRSQESLGLSLDTSSILSQTSSQESGLSSKDPYYDPPFPNDVRRPQRTGFDKLFHFVNKHADALTSATKQYFLSHIEFGSCLTDFQGLRSRYDRIRALEDVDELSNQDQPVEAHRERVRFLNYYTASTGIPKKVKTQADDESNNTTNAEMTEKLENTSLEEGGDGTTDPVPGITIENAENGKNTKKEIEESPIKVQMQHLGEGSGVKDDEDEPPEMRHIDSMPIEDDSEHDETSAALDAQISHDSEPTSTDAEPISTLSSLPPIPAMPEEPEPIDLNKYTDKDEKKIAEKEQKRIMKAYQQAVKDRENSIKDRRKLIEKREKKARQDREKQLKEEQKKVVREVQEEEKLKATLNPPPSEENARVTEEKPKRDRKFCLLPANINGKRDPCWVRVYMEGVDEVGAHCGLFFPGPQYETLVGDVADRIEEWAKDKATVRAVLEEVA